jgi:hypothetical protein
MTKTARTAKNKSVEEKKKRKIEVQVGTALTMRYRQQELEFIQCPPANRSRPALLAAPAPDLRAVGGPFIFVKMSRCAECSRLLDGS